MSRSPRSKRHDVRLGALLVALGLLTVACVKPGDATVGLDKVSARLVFGVKEVKKSVLQNEPPPLAEILEPEILALEPEENDVEFIPIKNPEPECPSAPAGQPIDPYADQNVTGLPQEGVYLWRLDIVNGYKDAAATVDNISASRYIERAVRRVTKVSETVFTFEVVEPDPVANGLYRVYQYQTRTDGQTTVVDPPSNGLIEYPRVGDPERGLVLKRVYLIDKTGSEVVGTDFRDFNPVRGLLILPLEVAPGEDFSAAATDRETGDTYVFNTGVGNREVIDACGKLVSGWGVDSGGTLTYSNTPNTTWNLKYHYVVATQYGGLIVRQRFEVYPQSVPDGTGAVQIWAITLAGVTPKPLPDALK